MDFVLAALVALPFLGAGLEPVRRTAAAWVATPRGPVAWRALALPAALLAAVVAWGAAAGTLPLGAYVTAYGALLLSPTLLALLWPDLGDRRAKPWPLLLLTLVVLALWMPVELALLPPLPRLGAVGVPVAKFVAVDAALWLFLVVRPMRDVGYGFAFDGRMARTAVVGFVAFAAVALPVGFATGFLVWNPVSDAAMWVLRPVLIYFTIAIPEEFLFRGVVQRALVTRFGARAGLVVASVVFGVAHAPSPVYVLLATLAGGAYGWVYQRTGRVAAAAVTHAIVDAVWVLMLRR